MVGELRQPLVQFAQPALAVVQRRLGVSSVSRRRVLSIEIPSITAGSVLAGHRLAEQYEPADRLLRPYDAVFDPHLPGPPGEFIKQRGEAGAILGMRRRRAGASGETGATPPASADARGTGRDCGTSAPTTASKSTTAGRHRGAIPRFRSRPASCASRKCCSAAPSLIRRRRPGRQPKPSHRPRHPSPVPDRLVRLDAAPPVIRRCCRETNATAPQAARYFLRGATQDSV